MLKVSASTSTKIGVAPTSTATSAVAQKVNEGQITASPGPMPWARNASTKRIGAAGAAHGVARAAEGGELGLDRAHFGTEDELTMRQHARDRRIDRAAQPPPLGTDINERNGWQSGTQIHALAGDHARSGAQHRRHRGLVSETAGGDLQAGHRLLAGHRRYRA